MQKYRYEQKNLMMEYIRDNGHRFSHYPPCQRDLVWKLPMQQRLIDTALRRLPIPPLVVSAKQDFMAGVTFNIIDGQQRYETLRSYLNNEFRTAKSWRDPHASPICPDKFYSELPKDVKEGLDSYSLRIDVYYDVPDNVIEMMFRNLQFHIPLNGSEKLWSYSSPVKTACTPLLDHSFWRETYKGVIDRKQAYNMTLRAVLMEVGDTFLNLTTPRLRDAAAGTGTVKSVDCHTVENIDSNLAIANQLFCGAKITGMSHFIPVYQAVRLLKDEKCIFDLVPKGKLAEWFNSLRLHLLKNRRTYNVDAFARLTKVRDQREFWAKEMPKLRTDYGLKFRDRKRAFSTEQRLEAWLRQRGKCAICGRKIMAQADAHHIKQYKDGGKTEADNCVLVHRKCHKNLDENDDQLQLSLIAKASIK